MVMTKGGGGTHQSATMRDTQAPKHKDMRLTTVGGGGGRVWHGVLVCQGGDEGGGWCTGEGCSSCHLIVLLCLQGKEFRKGYKGGGQEVLVMVPPSVGMAILSIIVRGREGAGIISKEDAQIATVRPRGKTIGGVYRQVFGNDAGFHAK